MARKKKIWPLLGIAPGPLIWPAGAWVLYLAKMNSAIHTGLIQLEADVARLRLS